jgi:hypothetical protein
MKVNSLRSLLFLAHFCLVTTIWEGLQPSFFNFFPWSLNGIKLASLTLCLLLYFFVIRKLSSSLAKKVLSSSRMDLQTCQWGDFGRELRSFLMRPYESSIPNILAAEFFVFPRSISFTICRQPPLASCSFVCRGGNKMGQIKNCVCQEARQTNAASLRSRR